MTEPTTFIEHVEGVGTFTFRRRTMQHELAIAAEFSRFLDGVSRPTEYLERMAGMLATLKVLTAEAPDGWDPMAADPLDPATYEKLILVNGALSAREAAFRPRPAQPRA